MDQLSKTRESVLLDCVCRYLPSPEDKDAIIGTKPDEEISRKPAESEPFSAPQTFKIATDPYVSRLALGLIQVN